MKAVNIIKPGGFHDNKEDWGLGGSGRPMRPVRIDVYLFIPFLLRKTTTAAAA